MASYLLAFKPSVLKDLRKLPGDAVERVYSRIESLAVDPFPPGMVKLSGAERLYRIRVGDYRVIYEVNPASGPSPCSTSGTAATPTASR